MGEWASYMRACGGLGLHVSFMGPRWAMGLADHVVATPSPISSTLYTFPFQIVEDEQICDSDSNWMFSLISSMRVSASPTGF